MWKKSVIILALTAYYVLGEDEISSRGLPAVEKAPLLLNSFIPASMQVIAHLTELMKYDVRQIDDSKTTTTIRPTPAHNPAIYAPKNPLGAEAYFAKANPFDEYLERLKKTPGSYFDRYFYPLVENKDEFDLNQRQFVSERTNRALSEDLSLLGPKLSDLVKQINKVEDYDFEDEEDKVLKFSSNYDDTYFRGYLIGNKKIPPTRAYVTMLQIYDNINKEAKALQLSKYGGYSDDVLQVLIETSKGSSSEQLKIVLGKVIDHHSLKDQKNIKKVNSILDDLEASDSYLNDAIKNIPPLEFSP